MKKTTHLFLVLSLLANTLFAQIDLTINMTNEDKIFGLTKFYSEAAYNFAYFDKTNINWDSAYRAFIPRVLATKNKWEYIKELERFCALLKDGHTNIYRSFDVVMYNNAYFQILFKKLGDRIIVSDVPKGKVGEVPVGSEVLKVEGIPVKTFIEQNILPYISASTEHQRWNDALAELPFYYITDSTKTLALSIRKPDNSIVDVNTLGYSLSKRADWVNFKRVPFKRFEYKMLENSIAYINIKTFDDDSIVHDFKKILPELYKAKSIIIDIRENGGGNSSIGGEVLKYFTDKKMIYGSKWRTREHRASYKAWGAFMKELKPEDAKDEWKNRSYKTAKGEFWYEGDTMTVENDIKDPKLNQPLIVLFGNKTASAAEDFLIFLSDLKGRATTIGEPSYGSTGQPLSFELPGQIRARICTKRDTYPDGRDFVGVGVKPDILVTPTVKDVIENEDIVLKKALSFLQK
jgi:carboxyl-terminal processing protease